MVVCGCKQRGDNDGGSLGSVAPGSLLLFIVLLVHSHDLHQTEEKRCAWVRVGVCVGVCV